MMNSPTIQSSSLLSRQSSKSKSKAMRPEPPRVDSSGCCRRGVRTVESTTSPLELQQRYDRLEAKVAGLEKEVQRQTELRVMYRKRMERTQDYLRYCLQVAQEKGVLDLIVQNKDEFQQAINSATPPIPPAPLPIPPPHHPNLATIIHQSKIAGWYIHPTEIQLGEKIGQGTTAEIHGGTWRGCEVAVKCITAEFFHTNANGVAFFAQEVETLSKQRNRFVLHLMGACLDPPHHAWLVTEYLSTTLKDWLHGSGNNRKKGRTLPLPPLKERVTKALEISQGMQYLHEQKPKLIHRDLKPSNIFLDDAMHVRVADFGHARFLDDHEMALTGETGTYVYMAPEVIKCEPYNEKCDVYSFGVILNELLTGKYPFVETDFGPAKIAMEVMEGKMRPMLASGEDEEVIDLVCSCWDGNPSKRPSFATITRTLKTYVNRLHSSS